MNVIRCINGHFYDADTYLDCPHCHINNPIDEKKENELKHGWPLLRKRNKGNDYSDSEEMKEVVETDKTECLCDTDRTVLLEDLMIEPVIGWLVCVKGQSKGACINLYNNMSSPIEFDKNDKKYYLRVKENDEILLNGTVLNGKSVIKSRELVTLRGRDYMFVPLCDENFMW